MRRMARNVTMLVALVATMAWATDSRLILVHPDRLSPDRIEIHNGETVTWRAASGQELRLEMDAYPAGHEVVERTTEIRATFREPGRHGYAVRLGGHAGAFLRGAVVVFPGDLPAESSPICAPGSSPRICFEP